MGLTIHYELRLAGSHEGIGDLLATAESAGLKVKINDEGGYWPGGDLRTLEANLDQMNSAIAAVAGALKDDDEANAGARVQSPILAHPRFERLEAEGEARGYVSRLRKLLR